MNRSKRTIAGLCGLVAAGMLTVTGASAPAFAQSAKKPAAQKERADEVFEQAMAAFDAGRLQEAEAKLEEAWALKKTHDIAGNLGIVELKLGKAREAAEHLAFAVEHFPPTESEKARTAIQKKLGEARAQLGALRIRVSVDGAEVTVNGRAAGVAPLGADVFVDAGVVTVVARHDGYMAAQEIVTIAKGADAREVSLTLVPIGGKSAGRSIVPGVVLASVAGAAVVTGIGLVIGGSGKLSSAKELNAAITKEHRSCVAGAANFDMRCEELESTASSADAFGRAGVGLLVGGGVVGVGALVYFLWPASAPASSGGSARTIRAVPFVSPTGSGFVVSGAF